MQEENAPVGAVKSNQMFSTGQAIFALLFIIGFTIAVVLMYRKDSGWLKKEYKGVQWILLAFVSFVIILFFLKYILR